MKENKKLDTVMNYVILSSFVWVFADPEIKFNVTKIHLIITALFLAYKILKK